MAGEVVGRGTAGLPAAQRHAEGQSAVHAQPALLAQLPGRFAGRVVVELQLARAVGDVRREERGEAGGGGPERELRAVAAGEILLVAELLLGVGGGQLEEGGSQQELRAARRLHVRQQRGRQRVHGEEGTHRRRLRVLAEHRVGNVAQQVHRGVDQVVPAVAALRGGGREGELLRVHQTAARREEAAGHVREERLLAGDATQIPVLRGAEAARHEEGGICVGVPSNAHSSSRRRSGRRGRRRSRSGSPRRRRGRSRDSARSAAVPRPPRPCRPRSSGATAAAQTTRAAQRSDRASACAAGGRNSRSDARAPQSPRSARSVSHPLRNAHQLCPRVLLQLHQQCPNSLPIPAVALRVNPQQVADLVAQRVVGAARRNARAGQQAQREDAAVHVDGRYALELRHQTTSVQMKLLRVADTACLTPAGNAYCRSPLLA